MWTVNNTRIEVVQGDITKEHVDAIVNAANSRLAGGGGVDGAIHRAGGPAIMAECRKLGGCDTGDAKITTGGDLPAKYVIHAVGPVYHGGGKGEAELLASCYRRSLEVAAENGLKSIAFSAISCGVYGYPIPEAARIAMSAVKGFVGSYTQVELVRFVLFSEDVLQIFKHVANDIL
ncbi:MAG: O-acetyl-ADP-ribose deacetylase [Candidatus Hydrogenedentes bacterium]|nr:O-acetyl-ADP-ribose deacetylase [Candidatus Hydrogenedentota bacterium]